MAIPDNDDRYAVLQTQLALSEKESTRQFHMRIDSDMRLWRLQDRLVELQQELDTLKVSGDDA